MTDLKDNLTTRFGLAMGLSLGLNMVFLLAIARFSASHAGHRDSHPGFVEVVFQDCPECRLPPKTETPATPAPAPVMPLREQITEPPKQTSVPSTSPSVPSARPVLTSVGAPAPQPSERPQPSIDSLPQPAPKPDVTAATQAPVQAAPTVSAAPPKPTPEPTPTPRPTPRPTPEPTPTPKPTPPPTPKPTGPTREAEPTHQVQPTIPDSLKKGEFKSFVRVVVEIEADGSFEVTLRTSSGNPEVDQRVLEALKKWKWRPALKSGQALASTERFKFEFEVQ
nr:TonB family protein [Armatimonas sp.]